MSDMLIRWTKKTDGTVAFRCLRTDGTSTWQRQKDRFFAFHDLGHYAVETTLGLRFGFYGLVAAGWDVTDFGTPWPRGPMPLEAIPDAALAEGLAGTLDRERATGETPTADEINATFSAMFERLGAAFLWPVADADLAGIRACAAELWKTWRNLPPGGDLELPFSVPAAKA